MGADQEPSIEWADGGSKNWFFLGSFAVLFVSFLVGQWIFRVATPGVWGSTFVGLLAECGIWAAIAVPANCLYFLSVPCPRTLGLSAAGVMINSGLRWRAYAWKDVVLRDSEVVCFEPRRTWLTRVAISNRQRARVRDYIQFYAPFRA